MIIKITNSGHIQFIMEDALMPILKEGTTTVKRASHIEPAIINGDWKYNADMHPVGGPVLGPFDTRKGALQAEITWLEENIICSCN